MDQSPTFAVASDPWVFGRIALANALLSFVIGAIPMGLALSFDSGSFGRFEFVAALGTLLFIFALRAVQFPWWWVKAGRTRYEVVDGILVMRNAKRVLGEYPCEQIFLVRAEGFISWRDCLMNGFGIPDFPRVTIRTADVHVGPPILLWQHDSTKAFDELTRVVAEHVEAQKRRALGT